MRIFQDPISAVQCYIYVYFSGRSTRSYYWISTIINTNRDSRGAIWFGNYLADLALIVRRVRDTGVKHLVIWAILAIIFNIVGFIFALIPTDQFKN